MGHSSRGSDSTFFYKPRRFLFSLHVLDWESVSSPCSHSLSLLSMTKEDSKGHYIRRSKRWILRKDLLLQRTKLFFSCIKMSWGSQAKIPHLFLKELSTNNVEFFFAEWSTRMDAGCPLFYHVSWWGNHRLKNAHSWQIHSGRPCWYPAFFTVQENCCLRKQNLKGGWYSTETILHGYIWKK